MPFTNRKKLIKLYLSYYAWMGDLNKKDQHVKERDGTIRSNRESTLKILFKLHKQIWEN